MRRWWIFLLCLALATPLAGCSTNLTPMSKSEANRWLASYFTGKFTFISQTDGTDPDQPSRTFQYKDQNGLEFTVTSKVISDSYLWTYKYVVNTTSYISAWYEANIDFSQPLAKIGLTDKVDWTWSSLSLPCHYADLAPLGQAIANGMNAVTGPLRMSVKNESFHNYIPSPTLDAQCTKEGAKNPYSLFIFDYPVSGQHVNAADIETKMEQRYVSLVRAGSLDEELPDEVLQQYRPTYITLVVGEQDICPFTWEDARGEYENSCMLSVAPQGTEGKVATQGQMNFAQLITVLGGEYVSDGFTSYDSDKVEHAEGRAHWTIDGHTWTAEQVKPPPPGVTSYWSLTVTRDGTPIDLPDPYREGGTPIGDRDYSLSDIEKLTGTTITVDYITSRAIVEL